MSLHSSPVRTQANKPGTCPHGLPIGACPICSGMAGGNSTTRRDVPRNVGEMSYNQCAAIGAMLRAQKLAQQSAKLAQQNHIKALVDFQKNLENTHQKLVAFAQIVESNFPKVISSPINFVVVNVIGKAINFVQNLPNNIVTFVQNFSQKIFDISDKLAAIYGEMKAALEENFTKFVAKLKEKLKFSFFVFGTRKTDDEEKKIEEDKRTFELKTFIHRLYKKNKTRNRKGM